MQVSTSGLFVTGDSFAALAWSQVPREAKFIFELVFAATAATIISGAMAGRTKFSAYIICSVAVTALIYPISGHWIWGGGWLAQLGMWDFAGSTVVHSVGGWTALVGAWMLGPRIGKYRADGSPRAVPGHNLPLATLGTLLLWFGWFGFNCGSTMAADATAISHIAVTTSLAAAAGALAAMFLSWKLYEKPDLGLTLNGTLAGLVGVTAGCAFVSSFSAVVIGLLAGVVMVLAVGWFDRRGIDDPVGAISVHGVCGALGTLAVGLFAQNQFAPGTTGNGLLFGGGWHLLEVQALGVVAVFAWCMVAARLLFGTLKATVGLRVSHEEELAGLDISEHAGRAYAPEMFGPVGPESAEFLG